MQPPFHPAGKSASAREAGGPFPPGAPSVDLVFIVPHTHWDREWYLPFEQFRMRLVDTVDRLLEWMAADPAYERFTLDGQSIVVEDYLAVRPEREPALAELVRQGRLAVGPWYVLPDEFLVSGEALVRNLLIGRRKAGRLGPVMPVGYLPDSFGHIGQLPQILARFGLPAVVLSRGVGDEGEYLGSEFWWEAPDGSCVLVLHQVFGYCNLAALGYRRPSDLLEGRPADPGLAVARIRREVARLQPYTRCGVAVLYNGCDHQPPSRDLPALIARVREALPQWTIRWATPAEVVVEVTRRARPLGVHRGELRGSRYAPLIPGVLSTRLYLKQANEAAQRSLECGAEPWSAVAWALGADDPRPWLDRAWEELLRTHPHDSICGCSVDAVHREMLPRFDRSRQVAQEITRRSMEFLAHRVDTAALPEGLPLLVFNSLGWPRTEVARVAADVPARWARAPQVVDAAGRPVPVQVLRRTTEVLVREGLPADAAARLWWLSHEVELAWGVRFCDFRLARDVLVVEAAAPELSPPDVLERVAEAAARRRPRQVRVERTQVEVAFLAEDVPAVGYRAYALRPGRGRPARPTEAADLRGRTMRNRWVEVEVLPNGALRMVHRGTGARYSVHLLEDAGDAGDEYDFSPLGEPPLTTGRLRGRVTPLRAGPVLATVRVDLPLRLPAGLTADRRKRMARRVACPVSVEVSLTAGSPQVECALSIDNAACDHRLRALFPSGLRASHYVADTAFGVVERPVGVPVRPQWAQPPQPTAPHQSWVDVSDGRRGLAVLARGLPEHEVREGPGGLTVALTLLRCVGWLSRDDLRTRRGHAGPGYETPEAQCLGRQHASYAVLPHAGSWEDADLVRRALAWRVPLVVLPHHRHPGRLPPSCSFLTADGAVLSAVKPADAAEAVVVRVYNASPQARVATIRPGFPHTGVTRVSLAEEGADGLPSEDGRVSVELRPFQIATVALALGRPPQVPGSDRTGAARENSGSGDPPRAGEVVRR